MIDLLLQSLYGLLAFVALVLVIVGIHEGGHFLAAKAVGVRVLEFNIGFGQKILAFTWGGTQYALRLLPLGGYVLMAGMNRATHFSWPGRPAQPETEETRRADAEAAAEIEAPGAFLSKAVWKRALVIAAGPLANVLLAFVIITVDVSIGDPAHVDAVAPGGAAAVAGLRAGDEIQSIAGQPINYTTDIYRAVGSTHGGPVRVIARRGDQTVTVDLVPTFDSSLGRYLMGIHPAHIRFAPAQAAQIGWDQTSGFFTGTISGLYQLATGAIPGGITGKNGLTGMVGVVGLTNQYAHEGPDAFAAWAAFFSVQLALINLFPLPILDGGRLVLLAVEAARRRPLSAQRELIVNYIGLAIILGFAVLINLNDVRRLVLH